MTTPGQASQWFANLKPKVGRRLSKPIASDNFIKSISCAAVAGARGGADRRSHYRMPQEPARAESADRHSGFVAYVPAGSIAPRGKNWSPRGGSAKRLLVSSVTDSSLGGWPGARKLLVIHRCISSANSTTSRMAAAPAP